MLLLTYASIMVSDIQKITTATAVVAAPGIFAATFRALTGLLLFALVNICMTQNQTSTNYKSILHTSHRRGTPCVTFDNIFIPNKTKCNIAVDYHSTKQPATSALINMMCFFYWKQEKFFFERNKSVQCM